MSLHNRTELYLFFGYRLLFLVIVIITLYNPVALQQMWVALIFFPVMLSLLVGFRVYVVGSVIFHCISYSFKFLVPRMGMTTGFLPLLWRRQKTSMH